MKTWHFAIVLVAVGVAVGYGKVWYEFHNLTQQFETHNSALTPGSERNVGVTVPQAVIVGGDSYDFGSGQRGSKMEHSFTVRNDGNAPLHLTMGGTTCKCTLGALENDELMPGKSAPIKLSWRVVTIGTRFRQSATIHTDDPTKRDIILEVSGIVTDRVKLDPFNLALSSISAGEEITSEFHVYSYGEETLELLDFSLSNTDTADFFDVHFDTVEPGPMEEGEPQPTHAIRGTVKVKPGLPLGPINQTVRLTTNVDKEAVLELVIVGSVVSDISVVGSNYGPKSGILNLGIVSRSEGKEAGLKLLVKGPYRDDVDFRVTSVKPQDVLETEWGELRTINEGVVHMYPLTIRVPKDARPVTHLSARKEELGKIVIETSHPIAKEIIIYVRFAVE